MLNDIFKVNQRLEIMLSKAKNSERYSSRIEEVTPNHLIIAMPIHKGMQVMIARGKPIYGRLITSGAVYKFSATFLDKRFSPLPIWMISYPTDVQKIQQRAFVRVGAIIPITICLITDEETAEECIPLNLMTRDVSGGGVQIISKQPFDIGTRLEACIDLPGYGPVEVVGQVVRVEWPEVDRSIYWVSIRFTEIVEKDRDKIIKFVFKKQLEQRQKGL